MAPEMKKPEEQEITAQNRVVISCIDWRTIEYLRTILRSEHGLSDGDYRLFATAGATLNPQVQEQLQPATNTLQEVVGCDHQDCGFAKKQGDDSDQKHNESMTQLGQKLKEENPNLTYTSNLITLDDNQRAKHRCNVVVITQGDPTSIQTMFEEMDSLSYVGNHDIIARPYELKPDDESVWTDLEISLSLHEPFIAYIVHNDRATLEKLAQIAKKKHNKLTVNTILVPTTQNKWK